jgi:glycosyltransferase involved in cell wall biosynthesis
LLAAADIYCQPNIGPDAFGIAFIEALYAGLPVMTSAIGGGGEVVTPSCGILLEPGDAQALAGALRQLIDDPQRRRLLAAAGPARAKELCDPRVVLPRLHRTLANLCVINPAKMAAHERKPLQKVAVQPFVVKN